LIYIKGDGFDPYTTIIRVGDLIFSNINATITYNSISFTTQLNKETKHRIFLKSNDVEALCFEECDLLISTINPPKINNVRFNLLKNKFLIMGENFGDNDSKLSVNIGDQNCIITFLNDSFVLCNLEVINKLESQHTQIDYLNVTIKG
jgi:hypothetical protein